MSPACVSVRLCDNIRRQAWRSICCSVNLSAINTCTAFFLRHVSATRDRQFHRRHRPRSSTYTRDWERPVSREYLIPTYPRVRTSYPTHAWLRRCVPAWVCIGCKIEKVHAVMSAAPCPELHTFNPCALHMHRPDKQRQARRVCRINLKSKLILP